MIDQLVFKLVYLNSFFGHLTDLSMMIGMKNSFLLKELLFELDIGRPVKSSTLS